MRTSICSNSRDTYNPFQRSQNKNSLYLSKALSPRDQSIMSNWDYEQSTDDDMMLDMTFTTQKNDIKPIFTNKKFQHLTHDLVQTHYKKSIHKSLHENAMPATSPSTNSKEPQTTTTVTNPKSQSKPPITTGDFTLRMKTVSESPPQVINKKGIPILLSECDLECYLDQFKHTSTKFIDDLYSVAPREAEGYLRKHFGFIKIGHARKLSMKILKERGDFKPQGVFKYDRTKSGDGTDRAIEFSVRFPNLMDWLSFLKLEHLYKNFADSGYEDYENMIMMMCSEHYLINDMVLKNDLKLQDYEERRKLLIRLYKDRESALKIDLNIIPNYGEIVFGEEYQKSIANCRCSIF